MTWLTPKSPNLIELAGRWPVEWWLAYGETEGVYWWNRFLKPGFRHVQALKRDGSIWLAFRPHAEFLDVDVLRGNYTAWQIIPDAVIQRVVALRTEGVVRSRWHTGPITCVEHVKALLGIRAATVRTPYQLYRYCGRVYGEVRQTSLQPQSPDGRAEVQVAGQFRRIRSEAHQGSS